ncbi:MAG: acyl carrier protein [Gammaproteobacteria bacterium]
MIDQLCALFGEQYRGEISLQTTMDDIPEWDSLSFVDVVCALETTFNVTVGPNDAANMTSVGAIQEFLRNAGAL